MKTKPLTTNGATPEAVWHFRAEDARPKRWWKNGHRFREPQEGEFILRGPLNRTGTLLNVWCPYCQVYHHHSWDPAYPNKPKHREAHCGGWSPLKGPGYFIAPIHSYTAAEKRTLGSLK